MPLQVPVSAAYQTSIRKVDTPEDERGKIGTPVPGANSTNPFV